MGDHAITLIVNGTPHRLLVEPQRVLLAVLREDIGLTGTKFGCELGECGVCTVLINGEPALSCITLAALCDGDKITTVEGIDGREAEIVAEAFATEGAAQCGYCTPSMAVMVWYLLRRGDAPDAREALSGNLCRCTGYTKIIKAYERCIQIASR